MTPKLVGRVAIVAILLMTVVTAVQPAGAAGRRYPNKIKWTTCNEEVTQFTGVSFECAPFKVPLDYDEPNGKTMTLDLIRIPASDPTNRQGAILVNPGGPGGSGVDFVLGFGPFISEVLGPEVPARFDIVGFDPRGVAGSTPIRCFANERRAIESLPLTPFPLTDDEVADFQRSNDRLALNCSRRGQARRVGPHMSTANVARDMDQIRERMGEEQLNYFGGSYGTFLGATYANLFPERVRSFVVDGVLDPEAWVNIEGQVPFSTRLRSDEGAQKTLEKLFTLCEEAAPGNCALAPDPADRYAALADRLRQGPLEIVDPFSGEAFLLTYQDLIGFTLGTLYDAFQFADFAAVIAAVESFVEPPVQPAAGAAKAFEVVRADLGPDAAFRQRNYQNFVESFPAVACADSNNPSDLSTWVSEGEAADAAFGYFGRIWTWASAPCQNWPFADTDRYEGPFTADTANPVLIIGNLYDPATRYEGAQTLRSLLPNSGLLTVDVPGHTSLGLSICAGFVSGQYLLDPTVAYNIDGTVCPAEYNPFDLVASLPAAASSARSTTEGAGQAQASLPEIRETVNQQLLPSPVGRTRG